MMNTERPLLQAKKSSQGVTKRQNYSTPNALDTNSGPAGSAIGQSLTQQNMSPSHTAGPCSRPWCGQDSVDYEPASDESPSHFIANVSPADQTRGYLSFRAPPPPVPERTGGELFPETARFPSQFRSSRGSIRSIWNVFGGKALTLDMQCRRMSLRTYYDWYDIVRISGVRLGNFSNPVQS